MGLDFDRGKTHGRFYPRKMKRWNPWICSEKVDSHPAVRWWINGPVMNSMVQSEKSPQTNPIKPQMTLVLIGKLALFWRVDPVDLKNLGSVGFVLVYSWMIHEILEGYKTSESY